MKCNPFLPSQDYKNSDADIRPFFALEITIGVVHKPDYASYFTQKTKQVECPFIGSLYFANTKNTYFNHTVNLAPYYICSKDNT